MKAAKAEFEKLKTEHAACCQAVLRKEDEVKARDTELERLHGMLKSAEERNRTLELNNYALTVHLERATGPRMNNHGAPPPPDIF